MHFLIYYTGQQVFCFDDGNGTFLPAEFKKDIHFPTSLPDFLEKNLLIFAKKTILTLYFDVTYNTNSIIVT